MSFRKILRRLAGFSPVPQTGLEFVDYYLEQWERFARGDSIPRGILGEAEEAFEEELVRLFRAGDSRAISRAVFYAVVQVGHSIRADDDLGVEIEKIVGSSYQSVDEDEAASFFAGNLFLWWREHRGRYPRFRPLERWERLPTSQGIIQGYEHIGQSRKG